MTGLEKAAATVDALVAALPAETRAAVAEVARAALPVVERRARELEPLASLVMPALRATWKAFALEVATEGISDAGRTLGAAFKSHAPAIMGTLSTMVDDGGTSV